jgi:predicted nucleotidyltransferase component of viral defense system
MLNKDRHRLIMVQILKDIYSDIALASLLGFKGGTAAYFFYDLPRFSVDLDFDLLDATADMRGVVFQKVRSILLKYGVIKDEQDKNFTLFFAISYDFGEHQIKVEINTRLTKASYEMKSYLGIPMLVITQPSMLASKLVALTKRRKFASRDMYDVYYFLRNHWDIDRDVLDAFHVVSVADYLAECVEFINNVPDNAMLAGLGELVSEKEKVFIKEHLKTETIFLLQLYAETISNSLNSHRQE